MSHLKLPTIEMDEETEDWCRAHAVSFGPLTLDDGAMMNLVAMQRLHREKWGRRGPGVAVAVHAPARRNAARVPRTLGSILQERRGDLMSTPMQLESDWTADDAAYARATGRSREQVMAARKLWRETGGVITNDHVQALNAKLARTPFRAF